MGLNKLKFFLNMAAPDRKGSSPRVRLFSHHKTGWVFANTLRLILRELEPNITWHPVENWFGQPLAKADPALTRLMRTTTCTSCYMGSLALTDRVMNIIRDPISVLESGYWYAAASTASVWCLSLSRTVGFTGRP